MEKLLPNKSFDFKEMKEYSYVNHHKITQIPYEISPCMNCFWLFSRVYLCDTYLILILFYYKRYVTC